MTKKDFLAGMRSPLDGAVLKKYPAGNVMQYWADSPELYSGVFGRTDELGKFLKGHNGVDIQTFFRDRVRLPFDAAIVGIVEDRRSTGGLQVYAESPELEDGRERCVIQTGFAHLDEIAVKVDPGKVLTKGTLVGYEGNTGFVVSGNVSYWGNAPAGAGVHLHWQVKEFLSVGDLRRPRYPNLMGDTGDPLWYLNADAAGTLLYLANMRRLLEVWRTRGFGI